MGHPNAHLQMAKLYAYKFYNADILKASELLNYADSAIRYYNLALEYIDDREIKKNDEFYERYSERDLRTGREEIKLPTVHNSIKKQAKELKEQKDKVTQLNRWYSNFTEYYLKASNVVNDLQKRYPDKRILLLRGDDDVLSMLNNIQLNYDSSKANFIRYRKLLDKLPGMQYDQQWEDVVYKNIKTDPADLDLYNNNLEVYDLGSWSAETKSIIEKEINPLKKHIAEYDQELDKYYDQLPIDPAAIKEELDALSENLLINPFLKYDENPLPVQLFRLRLAELYYLSSFNEGNPTADVHDQMKQARDLRSELNAMDSLVNLLAGMDLTEETENYSDFVVNGYGSTDSLQAFIESRFVFLLEENKKLGKIENESRRQLDWIFCKNDSIPIVMDLRDTTGFFYPMQVVEERYSTGLILSGGEITGGYFTDINPTRRSKIKVDIAFDSVVFDKTKMGVTEVLTTSDKDDKIFYLVFFQPTESGTYNAAISKVFKEEGIAWTKKF